MCRWIAYHGEPVLLEDLIFRPSHSLVEQSLGCREGATRSNGDGYGIGWYGARSEPGLFREVLPAWRDPNLQALSQHITSPLIFAHVRAATGTETSRLNCHPFAYDNWMFMHNGQIGGYERCRGALETLLDDGLARYRHGSTDSELFFLLMVQNGLDADPHCALRTTIAQITEVAEACRVNEPFKLTVCFSDGERLYACRHSTDGRPPSLYWQVGAQGVLVASEPNDCGKAPWNEVAADSILTVGHEISLEALHPGTAQTSASRILRVPPQHIAA